MRFARDGRLRFLWGAAMNTSSPVPIEVLDEQVQKAWDELIAFCSQQPFLELTKEMWSLPVELQQEFAETAFHDASLLVSRGAIVPDGLVVQRSLFEDARPTLFCVTKKLPDACIWDKITATFDCPIGVLKAPAWQGANIIHS